MKILKKCQTALMFPATTLFADVFRCVMLSTFAGLSSSRFSVRYSQNDIVNIICLCNVVAHIQGIDKIMVGFQKLIRNLFLTLHGHNVHRQQR